ncbi:MAG: fasciclin domain-containing protein [Gemmatimonadales bacterium]|nr:MAG: fasciclin domain-containing protein [Gemmatimonadales bacterium]
MDCPNIRPRYAETLMKRILTPVLGLVTLLAIGACSDLPTTSDSPALNTEAAAELAAANRGAAGRGAAIRAPAPGDATIAEIVVASTAAEAPEFTLLLAAIGHIAETNPESALIEGLFNRDQFTVFAPTDAAFLALVDAVSDLLDPSVLAGDGPFVAIDDLLGDGTVEAVVSYHVAEGRRAANSVVPPNARQVRTIETLLGVSFTVANDLGITAVGSSASIAAPNISASNGIIHVIDAVLLPIDLGL